ncbi:hypothetical protein [Chryseobacterium wangxinyae]|uniref:hypothetical protein n=1 Tax=Chryseobacterium sp. CY353 TaxID=2997334 RepID=UPI0022712E8F|nr:hypothetical protein [Chryseobacterium sp. CY353]MCY0968596.1 hypothetical protein [Chryseobacterium sp. CY353]
MNYKEALQHKKESVEKADDSILKLYHIVITPANTDESYKYIEDFTKNPEKFNDESCKKYCTDGEYEVVSFKRRIKLN